MKKLLIISILCLLACSSVEPISVPKEDIIVTYEKIDCLETNAVKMTAHANKNNW